FLQAEDGIRVFHVTGVQTCALPIYKASAAFDERVLVAERHEIAARAVAQKVALPAPIEAHDRQTARHRLEKYQAEALVLAGRHRTEERRVGKESRYAWRQWQEKRNR